MVKVNDNYYRLFHMALMILLATLLNETVGESEPCPCYCDESHRMNCVKQRWKVIPSFIPARVTVISLQANDIKTIKENAFGGVINNLTLLRLDNNKINTIQPGAFNGLPKLNQLVLEKNRIGVFDARMLDPTSPLNKGISLKNNRLKTFPMSVLVKYKSPLNVNNNKIKCDCLSVIPDQLKHLVSGTCHSPGYVKGRLLVSLTYRDVKCDVCTGNKCVHGFCYTRGRRALCSCIRGYSGDLCQIKDKTTTTPTTTTITTTPLIPGPAPIIPTTTAILKQPTTLTKTKKPRDTNGRPKTSKRPKTRAPSAIKTRKISIWKMT